MTREHAVCALCDEYSVKQADPELAKAGMGRCLMRPDSGVLALHVRWDDKHCVSFRLDRENLAKRRQYVEMRLRSAETTS